MLLKLLNVTILVDDARSNEKRSSKDDWKHNNVDDITLKRNNSVKTPSKERTRRVSTGALVKNQSHRRNPSTAGDSYSKAGTNTWDELATFKSD